MERLGLKCSRRTIFLFLDMNKVHQLISPIDSVVILVSLVTTAIYIYTSQTDKTNKLHQKILRNTIIRHFWYSFLLTTSIELIGSLNSLFKFENVLPEIKYLDWWVGGSQVIFHTPASCMVRSNPSKNAKKKKKIKSRKYSYF